jgi:hypothetical protein
VTEASEIQLLATDGHSFCAHVAFPDPVAPAPCVVLLHEIFGINSYMLAMAREFAAAGFVALIPDLFARQERDVNLAYEGPDFDHAIKLRDNLDFALALTDISAAVQWGRTTDRGNGAIAAVGYCLGGGLAFITAATADVDCAVSYYARDMPVCDSEMLLCPDRRCWSESTDGWEFPVNKPQAQANNELRYERQLHGRPCRLEGFGRQAGPGSERRPNYPDRVCQGRSRYCGRSLAGSLRRRTSNPV